MKILNNKLVKSLGYLMIALSMIFCMSTSASVMAGEDYSDEYYDDYSDESGIEDVTVSNSGDEDTDVSSAAADSGADTTMSETSLHVYDYAGILTADQVSSLDSKAASISDKYQSGTYIIILQDYHEYGSDVDAAARNLYNSMGFGLGSDQNGELLLLSMGARDYSLTVHGVKANEAFSEYARNAVIDEFLDDFHDNSWNSGLTDYLDKSSECLELAADGKPLTIASSSKYQLIKWGSSALIGIILAIIIGLGIKSTMKSVAQKVEARNYVKKDSFDVSYRNDYFKYSTETRTKIEKSSSSSSGSSGGFSSSSGKF